MNSCRGVERRRSPRAELQIPLIVRWTWNGRPREEATVTWVVNAHGCLTLLKQLLPEGLEVELENRATQAVSRGRVAWSGERCADGRSKIGIDLETPDPEFWGPIYTSLIAVPAFPAAPLEV